MPSSALGEARRLLPELARIEDPDACCDALERTIWQADAADPSSQPDPERLALLQRLYRELEAAGDFDRSPRHDFLLVVPVADRPRQLRVCLHSLLQLCETFHYGGRHEHRFPRLHLLLADDSRDPDAMLAHAQLAREISALGLTCEHFDRAAQRGLFEALDSQTRTNLAALIGVAGAVDQGHKGASVMRNLVLLELARRGLPDRTLIHFFDSDQEFGLASGQINAPAEPSYCFSHYHQLDRLFRNPDLVLVTGKVVGDPPVAPAVMAGRLLEDIQGFLEALARSDPLAVCGFHQPARAADDAAYHDMAELFGFRTAARVPEAFPYACPLGGPHDHLACLDQFVTALDGFLDGHHPTRSTAFVPGLARETLQPARTVYTGNYVLRANRLDLCIPFAALRLRMAGPTLGRLLQTRLGAGFCATNLPMLHRRTLADTGQSECRPGVQRSGAAVELGEEFGRQFEGDTLLFSVVRLVDLGFPDQVPQDLDAILDQVQREMRERYRERGVELSRQLDRLDLLLSQPTHWWNSSSGETSAQPAIQRLRKFLAVIRTNLGKDAPTRQGIEDAEQARSRSARLAAALRGMSDQEQAWRRQLRRFAQQHN